MKIKCPHCECLFRPKPEWAGRTAKCKSCNGRFVIPASLEPESPIQPVAPLARELCDDAQVKPLEAPVVPPLPESYDLDWTAISELERECETAEPIRPTFSENPSSKLPNSGSTPSNASPPSLLAQNAVRANGQPNDNDDDLSTSNRITKWVLDFLLALYHDDVFRVGIGAALLCLGSFLVGWAVDRPEVSPIHFLSVILLASIAACVVFALAILIELGCLLVASRICRIQYENFETRAVSSLIVVRCLALVFVTVARNAIPALEWRVALGFGVEILASAVCYAAFLGITVKKATVTAGTVITLKVAIIAVISVGLIAYSSRVGPDRQFFTQNSGDHRLELTYSWKNADGTQEITGMTKSDAPCLLVSRSLMAWNINCFDKRWHTRTTSLSGFQLDSSLTSIAAILPKDDRFHTIPLDQIASCKVTLTVARDTFNPAFASFPQFSPGAPARYYKGSAPPGAVVTETRAFRSTDSFGKTTSEHGVIAYLPRTAGFTELKARFVRVDAIAK